MYARPAASLRQHSHIRLLGWLAAATLAAIALLTGTSFEWVFASGETPSMPGPGKLRAEADPPPTPTPAPTPESTPTHQTTPAPSPEPTPGSTPELTPVAVQSPDDTFGAEVVARKVIDADGNLETFDDQTAGEGWEFELELPDGTINEAFPITSSDGLAGWLIGFGTGGTSATLTEEPLGDFELLDASCTKVVDSGDEPVGEFDGDSITFQVDGSEFPSYQCTFVNVPSDTRLAGISVWKHIDADGDLDTSEDHESPSSWEFEAAFEGVVEIVSADPDTDRDEPAGWLIRHVGDSTRVVVTEVPRAGYRLLKASCIDADSSDGMGIPTTLEGNSLSFDVSGFGPTSDDAHVYFCDFWNGPADVAALPTLPPTHAAPYEGVLESAPWCLALVGLAALLASLLVLGSRPAASRRQ
jgi:hypothetical protein